MAKKTGAGTGEKRPTQSELNIAMYERTYIECNAAARRVARETDTSGVTTGEITVLFFNRFFDDQVTLKGKSQSSEQLKAITETLRGLQR